MPEAPGLPHLGIAGLGLVGGALARRLSAAGYEVSGFDTDAARGAAFAALCKGTACASLTQLAGACDCLLVAVFDDAQLRAVTAGLLGVANRRASRVICITTALPATLRAAGIQCAAKGIAFIEAPISGSSAKIAAGEGRMFVGGDPADIEAAAPMLDAITVHRKVIGPVGRASAAKLATNLVLGLNRAALAEGMALAESLGIERAHYLDLLLDSAATSRAAQEKGPMMVADDYEPPVATVAQHAKDVGLMLALGQETGQALPMSELHMEILQRSIERGDAALDNAAVIRVWRPARP